MVEVAFTCSHCGGTGLREAGDYNRKVRAGAAMHCSRPCAYASYAKRASDKAAARQRTCETCGNIFTPRQRQIEMGGGRYCSQKCNKAFHHASQREDVWAERIITMREKRERGEWRVPTKEEKPNWKGGPEACIRRRRESGKEAEGLRRYRKNNPDKVRSFTARRKGRKLGRLEYGTVPRLLVLQKHKCAICRQSIRKEYHLDHIVPLARGGEHRAANVQLLCPTCNVRKSSRDPIDYMQSLGRLL